MREKLRPWLSELRDINIMRIVGIYKIESIIKPNKIYIGSSINVKDRIGRHKVDFRRNEHPNYKMQRHYNKYGLEDFIYTVIEECDKNEVIVREQYYIDTLNPLFNICKIAGSYKGVKQTKKTLKKREGRSSWNKGLKGKDNPMTGNKPCSEETKRKLSEHFKGCVSNRKGAILSDESKKKMSDAKIGIIPWNKGVRMTEEQLKKHSENMKLSYLKRKLNQETLKIAV